MIQAVRSAFALPDLRKKILYTFLILGIYRLFAHVPVPGVNTETLRQLFESNQLLGLLDLLSGGAMANFSVMAMGVYPYITALSSSSCSRPSSPLGALQKEGSRDEISSTNTPGISRCPWPLAGLWAGCHLYPVGGGVPILDSLASAMPLPTFAILHDDGWHPACRMAGRVDQRAGHRQRHVDHHPGGL